MALEQCMQEMLPALEAELRKQVARAGGPGTEAFEGMLAYHMGWSGAGGTKGKRIRPLMMLLVVEGCGGKWLRAAPAAAAIELIHDFSLVHDDIEDDSPTRHGRAALWALHGVPMAVNAGDALFAIADQAVIDTSPSFPAETVLRAASVLHAACLALTRGQYLDMSYERHMDLSVNAYWPMVEGKTAALLSAATQMGAIFGGADDVRIRQFTEFGRFLGLAFQAQDDILGIWGDELATGKSAASDLVEGKNSLPVLYGLGRKGAFAERWAQGAISQQETAQVAALLKDEGALDYCQHEAERLTGAALHALGDAKPQGRGGDALVELAHKLLGRSS